MNVIVVIVMIAVCIDVLTGLFFSNGHLATHIDMAKTVTTQPPECPWQAKCGSGHLPQIGPQWAYAPVRALQSTKATTGFM